MAHKSLGKVTSTGGAVARLTANLAAADQNLLQCYSITVQQIAGNTGKIYIGLSTMVVATLVGVLYVLPIPATDGTSLPAWQDSIVNVPGGHDVAALYIISQTSGEGALVSVSIL